MSRLENYFIAQLVDIAEIQEIIRVLNLQLEKTETQKQSTLNNLFVETLNEYGCTRYEKMFGISPRASDSLEDRRFRILALLKGDLPYTIIALKNKLCDLCGEENVTVTLSAESYAIAILIGLESKNQYDTAYAIIQNMLPCNLTLSYGLKYNQYSTLGNFTHEQLAAYTYNQLRNEVLEG